MPLGVLILTIFVPLLAASIIGACTPPGVTCAVTGQLLLSTVPIIVIRMMAWNRFEKRLGCRPRTGEPR